MSGSRNGGKGAEGTCAALAVSGGCRYSPTLPAAPDAADKSRRRGYPHYHIGGIRRIAKNGGTQGAPAPGAGTAGFAAGGGYRHFLGGTLKCPGVGGVPKASHRGPRTKR